jgi:hypothetical protein
LTRLAEADKVSEGIDHTGLDHPPRHRFKAGPHVRIAFRTDLALKRLDAVHHDANMNAGTAVAVMLAMSG